MQELLVSAILILLLGVHGTAQTPGVDSCATTTIRSDDTDVYRAALAHGSIRGGNPKKPELVVVREISPDRSVVPVTERSGDYFRRFLRTPKTETITAFLCAAAGTGEVPATIGRESGVRLVAEATLRREVERPGREYWQEFARHYPRASGIASVSPIAYSSDGTEAMIYLEFSAGMLNAHGQAMVLRRVDNAWQVVELVHTWES